MLETRKKPESSTTQEFLTGGGLALLVELIGILLVYMVAQIAPGGMSIHFLVIAQLIVLVGGGIFAAWLAYRDGYKTRLAGLITFLSLFVLWAASCWGFGH